MKKFQAIEKPLGACDVARSQKQRTSKYLMENKKKRGNWTLLVLYE